MATLAIDAAPQVQTQLSTQDPPSFSVDPQACLAQVLQELEDQQRLPAPELEAARRQVVGALEGLPPLQRAAVLLHRNRGMSFGEIAAAIGVSSAEIRKAFVSGLVGFARGAAR